MVIRSRGVIVFLVVMLLALGHEVQGQVLTFRTLAGNEPAVVDATGTSARCTWLGLDAVSIAHASST